MSSGVALMQNTGASPARAALGNTLEVRMERVCDCHDDCAQVISSDLYPHVRTRQRARKFFRLGCVPGRICKTRIQQEHATEGGINFVKRREERELIQRFDPSGDKRPHSCVPSSSVS